MIEIVQDLARVYAENPARINDFLSAINGSFSGADRSEDLLFTLLHIDERAAERLGKKIDAIKPVTEAYRLKQFVDEARKRRPDGAVQDEEMFNILRQMEAEAVA